jgi:hypothetical protein
MSSRRDFVKLISASCININTSGFFSMKKRHVALADCWQFVGVAVAEEGYHIWGTSPIRDESGKVHLFVARWPRAYKVDPGWRSHAEIAHYVGPDPEGPFTFSDIALKGTGTATWDKFGVSNPAIYKVSDHYVLLYIANDNHLQPPHPANQCIGMAISSSLYGPWNKVNGDGRILMPPANRNYWNHNAKNGVVNPALLPYKGGYLLYFKSQDAKMGVAVAEELTGPYIQFPSPVTSNARRIEDGYAFLWNDKVCLLTTDNDGLMQKGGGILWQSQNGIDFDSRELGFHPIKYYLPQGFNHDPSWHYGPREVMKFERPQILMEEAHPGWLYVASGCNIYGGDSTVSYVLKYKESIK